MGQSTAPVLGSLLTPSGAIVLLVHGVLHTQQ